MWLCGDPTGAGTRKDEGPDGWQGLEQERKEELVLVPCARSVQPCSRIVPALSGPGNAGFTLLIPLGKAGAGRTSVHGSSSAGLGLGAWATCTRGGPGGFCVTAGCSCCRAAPLLRRKHLLP